MTPTIRSELDDRLGRIRAGLLEMNSLVAERVDLVTSALLERDVARADELIVADDDIDLISQTVDELCIDTLLREQPVAGDLRAVVAAMRMNSDIERSGDLTTNIAKTVGRMQGTKPDDHIRRLILQMATQARILTEKAGDAYERHDLELAESIDVLDDVLDDLHQEYIGCVIDASRHGSLQAHETFQLAMVGRFYERIGDHAENVGEHIRYIVSGWTPEKAGADRARARASGEEIDATASKRGLAIIDALSERRRIDETRRDFVANVSHELKTPIGAISLLAETLVEVPDSERKELTQRLLREVARASNIIDDLLELTRLEGIEQRNAMLSVDAIVTEAVDATLGLAHGRHIDLEVHGTPSGVEVEGEHRQLTRAIINLIDNAIRYSEDESTITIKIDPLQKAVDITVVDTGAGIAAAELERVFERFYRVDPARSRQTGGTGLGLAIVRHTAENHGGRVQVESELGVGSSFTLQLPLAGPPTES